MKSLLKIVTRCIDSFSEQTNVVRFAAIVVEEWSLCMIHPE
ncbi:MAG: hypothetical protein OQK65_04655 [Chlorobium sp.]|nr:hypothetical protein [Chlorobium sp.]